MGKYNPAPYQLDLTKYPNIITDTLPGTVTDSNVLQEQNAKGPITVTGHPSISAGMVNSAGNSSVKPVMVTAPLVISYTKPAGASAATETAPMGTNVSKKRIAQPRERIFLIAKHLTNKKWGSFVVYTK